MKIVRTEDLRGTDREVISPDGWTSVHAGSDRWRSRLC